MDFIAGRYETGEGEKVVKGVTPLGNKTWYEHYKIDKNMINANGIKSNMIWASQWDQTMIWFDSQGGKKKNYVYNSTGKGSYSGRIKTTGSDPEYAVNNIYDMAGNTSSWTLTAWSTGHRAERGGICYFNATGKTYPASTRGCYRPTDVNNYQSARVTLIL